MAIEKKVTILPFQSFVVPDTVTSPDDLPEVQGSLDGEPDSAWLRLNGIEADEVHVDLGISAFFRSIEIGGNTYENASFVCFGMDGVLKAGVFEEEDDSGEDPPAIGGEYTVECGGTFVVETKTVKALNAFSYMEDGELASLGYGEIAELPIDKAGAYTADGLVEPYTLITPTGTINIDTNGTHDVTQYANASVSGLPKISQITIKNSTGNNIEFYWSPFLDDSGALIPTHTASRLANGESRTFELNTPTNQASANCAMLVTCWGISNKVLKGTLSGSGDMACFAVNAGIASNTTTWAVSVIISGESPNPTLTFTYASA